MINDIRFSGVPVYPHVTGDEIRVAMRRLAETTADKIMNDFAERRVAITAELARINAIVDWLRGGGWPEGEARLADCTLLSKATPEYRRKLLQDMAAMTGSDARPRYAEWRLKQGEATG